jgi:23S rRNA pseudouridine1911/1915/1917 synthase
MQHFTFINQNNDLRIDSCLKSNMPMFSRSYLVTLIQARHVLVNNIVVTKSNIKVKLDDEIRVTIADSPIIKPALLEFEIIDDQPDFFIINKPAGVLTHPAATCRGVPSVAESIIDKIQFPEDYQGSNRAGIIHRLDKNTSGLLIVAKNPEALNKFSAIFQNHEVTKKYYAVSRGEPAKSTFTINTPIGRDPRDGIKMRVYGMAARDAKSVVVLEKIFENESGDKFSLLDVQIMSGRTHQVRVHLASVGLPILGDEIYGVVTPLISRQALHAHYLEFSYDGQLFQYECPAPEDIRILLDLVGK